MEAQGQMSQSVSVLLWVPSPVGGAGVGVGGINTSTERLIVEWGAVLLEGNTGYYGI